MTAGSSPAGTHVGLPNLPLTPAPFYVPVLFVSGAASQSIPLSDRLSQIVEGLCRAAAARMGVKGAEREAAGRLMVLLWSRLHRITSRFEALAARCRFRRFACRTLSAATPCADPQRPRRQQHLPHGFTWLVRLVPEAASYGAQLRHLLAAPEMEALLAASATARRLLRPLCRMLAVHPDNAPPPEPAARKRVALPATTPASPRPLPRPASPPWNTIEFAHVFAPV